MSSGMGVRGSHIPGASAGSGSVDPAKRPTPKKTPQGTPVMQAKQPAAKTTKPKSGKRR